MSSPTLRLDNRFVRELPGDTSGDPRSRQVLGACWSSAQPSATKAPRLLAWSREVATLLDVDAQAMGSDPWLAALSGNGLLPGMQPYAACYGGHQFGNWAGQLGDGRAITLGEAINARGERWELQLKGAGRTPYSRHADGRAVLRSSLREYLCSEAMFHLGVPTTRALSLVTTGDDVIRDMFYDGHAKPEPGAIVCRVAPSFVRFGNFEILAARRDEALLGKLLDFVIDRDYPHIAALQEPSAAKRSRFFHEVCERTAAMIVGWMRVGFVHGVMNTDNMSILGLTIDYGPYGFLDDYDPHWTPNTTDAQGRRYRYGQQPNIALWNLACLAEALAPAFADRAPLDEGLERYANAVNAQLPQMWLDKLGLMRGDGDDDALVRDLLGLMQRSEADYTLTFRLLADLDVDAPQLTTLDPVFYRDELKQQHATAWQAWLDRYAARVKRDTSELSSRRARMNAVNPRFIFRNYLAQEAIDLAAAGDTRRIELLHEVLRRPYADQPEHDRFADKRPDWARHKPGCSMLSCSS